MNRVLKDILNYDKILIVSNEEDDLLSGMIFNAIRDTIEKQRVVFNFKADVINEVRKDLVNLNHIPEYRYIDLFHEDVSKYSLKKYHKGDFNYVVRAKGNGFNINYMGLVDSQQMSRDPHLYLAVGNGMCRVLHDRLHDYIRRECDLDSLYKSYKLSKILKRLNGK